MATLRITKRYNLPEHSFMGIAELIPNPSETGLNPNIFVVKDTLTDYCPSTGGQSSSSATSSSSTSSSSAGTSSSGSSTSSSSGSAYPSCLTQTLIAIASLLDLELKALEPATPGGLYLTDSVTILCRSQRRLEEDLDRIIADVRLIMKLQRKIGTIESFKVEVIEDVALPSSG